MAPRRSPPTVTAMLYIIIGVLVGLGVAIGPLHWLAAPFNSVNDALVTSAERLVDAGAQAVGTSGNGRFVDVATVLLTVFAPGLVALGLVATARSAKAARRFVAGGAVIVAAVSFAWLPWGNAAMLVVVAVIFALLASFVEGFAIRAPLVALATALGASHVRAVLDGEGEIGSAVEQLSALSGVAQPGLWTLACTALAVFPFLGAAWMALRN